MLSKPKANKVLFENSKFTLHFNNGASFSFLTSSVGAIANLSVTDLDELSEALFDFNSSGDLASWLEK